MKRIAVIGSTGMLGHRIYARLSKSRSYVVVGCRRANFDATQAADRLRLLRLFKPDVVINCAGIIKQRPEAENTNLAIAVNALMPHQLAQECAAVGTRLIHFSTDCVFSGMRGLYTEGDSSDAIDLYGRSKYLGEVVDYPNAITLRTSIIGRELNGRPKYGLLEWFLAQRGKTIKGFTDAYFSGVTTNWLAATVEHLINSRPNLSGLYQVTTKKSISKFQLLHLLRGAYDLSVHIEPDSSVWCDRSMIGRKFEKETGIEQPTWPQLLTGLLEDSDYYEPVSR
jgi:dTDP-4-dehydrorhamnose reductase